MPFSDADTAFMRRALELARKALGPASPNPAVGCVIAAGDTVAGEGWTQPFGGPHAEVQALEEAGSAARGATAYVTLMPCAHTGKTPPCAPALIDAGIVRVVAALEDPNPESLDGAQVLRDGGVGVECGLCAEEAFGIIAGFVKHLRTGLPLVRLKYAMTLDGKIATRTGSSQWISSGESRGEVQRLRRESDAVLVGVGTVLADDPRLNVRDPQSAWQPRRCIVDSRCRTPADAHIFSERGGEVVILCSASAPEAERKRLAAAGATVIAVGDSDGDRPDLDAALKALAGTGVRTILCEGGATLAGALFDARLADEVIAYVAPKLAGGAEALSPLGGEGVECMADALPLARVRYGQSGPDLRIRARVGAWEWALPADEAEDA
jgi:diaminohydroxyphosphoribosylaminopyrimidine deaminase / 5-amino-6-(5-phosphoribosylamino)uracil reductase